MTAHAGCGAPAWELFGNAFPFDPGVPVLDVMRMRPRIRAFTALLELLRGRSTPARLASAPEPGAVHGGCRHPVASGPTLSGHRFHASPTTSRANHGGREKETHGVHVGSRGGARTALRGGRGRTGAQRGQPEDGRAAGRPAQFRHGATAGGIPQPGRHRRAGRLHRWRHESSRRGASHPGSRHRRHPGRSCAVRPRAMGTPTSREARPSIQPPVSFASGRPRSCSRGRPSCSSWSRASSISMPT